MNAIFSRQKLKADRDQSARYLDQNFLRQYASEQIAQRLALLGITGGKALEIGSHSGLVASKLASFDVTVTESSSILLALNQCRNQINIDDEDLVLKSLEYDIVISCLNLHWINDIEQFLYKIYQNLIVGGSFIANFIGGRSLRSLRKKLVELETQLGLPARSYISPFISNQDANILLKRAGFSSIITDSDVLEVSYSNCIALMRELKNLGEGNKLIKSAGQRLPKSLYLYLLALKEEFVTEFEIITIYGKK